MKITVKSTDVQIGDFVVGYNKTVANVWKSGFDAGVVITFNDGSETLTMKSWEMTVIREPKVSNWQEAEAAVRAFAAQYGVTAIYWGTGNPIEKPHAVASSLDAWSGEGMGYFVRVYPEGDHGCYLRDGKDKPCHMTTIRIK